MSLTTIPNQPVNFTTPEIYAKCRDTEPPLTVSENDPIIFQFLQQRCPDADQYLRKIGPSDWSGEDGWTVAAGTLTLKSGNSGKIAQEDNFAASVGTTYEVQVTISVVQGAGFRISVGGVDKVLNSLGVFAWVVTAETTGGAIVISEGDNSSGVVSAFEVFQANESFEVAFIEGVTEVIYSPSLNPSYFSYAGEHVIFNGPLPDEMEDCFHVELRDQCTPYEVVYCSQSIKIIGCEGTILLRVCNDSDALGFAAGYFTLRQPATLGSPNWEYEEESERLSNGFINRFFIDRQEISVLSIERVSRFLHPFLAAMAMFDHFYIEQTEYSIDADNYQPGYGDSETGTGAVQLSVRPKRRLMRRVLCDDIGEGCNPANDPICPQANAIVGTEYSEGVLFAFVEVFSNLGFFVSEAQWYLNGLEQTAILVAGTPGKYALGEVAPGDAVRVVFVDSQSLQQCPDDRGTFTVQSPCELSDYALTDVILDLGVGPAVGGETTSGYFGVLQNGTLFIIDNATFLHEYAAIGEACVYPCDADGTPSGVWTSFFVGDLLPNPMLPQAREPMDLSPLDGLTLTDSDYISASLAIYTSAIYWPTIVLPALVGSNGTLDIHIRGQVETVEIVVPEGVTFRIIIATVTSPATQQTVDDLCNALDPSAVGEISDICQDFGPAPSGDSYPARSAYEVNNTLNIFP